MRGRRCDGKWLTRRLRACNGEQPQQKHPATHCSHEHQLEPESYVRIGPQSGDWVRSGGLSPIGSEPGPQPLFMPRRGAGRAASYPDKPHTVQIQPVSARRAFLQRERRRAGRHSIDRSALADDLLSHRLALG